MMRLKGIARRKAKRSAMEEQTASRVDEAFGVQGDFRGQPGKRQVTVLSEESWQTACNEVGAQLPWTSRRANLLVEGMQFDASFVDKILQIGTLQLQITKETVPCFRMDEVCDGLQAALKSQWRGGVCCRVLQSGEIQVGDAVTLVGSP